VTCANDRSNRVRHSWRWACRGSPRKKAVQLPRERTSNARRKRSARDKPPATGALRDRYSESEIVIALVASVGTNIETVRTALRDRLKQLGYAVNVVRITTEVIPAIVPDIPRSTTDFGRITHLMDAGNRARLEAKNNAVLGLGAVASIVASRTSEEKNDKPTRRRAYIISALNSPWRKSFGLRTSLLAPNIGWLCGVAATCRILRTKLHRGSHSTVGQLCQHPRSRYQSTFATGC